MRTATILVSLLCLAVASHAGPPFQTDDPQPVPLHHWEAYVFATRDQTRGAYTGQGPAIEINNGVARNAQLHLVIPDAFSSQDGTTYDGFGDIEAGIKYRFLDQTGARPEIGAFPMVELPTGDSSKGLGNGRAWYKLPIWLQKDWDSWTTYGGGGFAYNPGPGQRNSWFGGDLVQCTFSPHWTLGGEVFLQGAQTEAPVGPSSLPMAGTRSYALWNVGGQYNFTPDCSLLFSVGRTFSGEGHNIAYLGLYRTWGAGSP